MQSPIINELVLFDLKVRYPATVGLTAANRHGCTVHQRCLVNPFKDSFGMNLMTPRSTIRIAV